MNEDNFGFIKKGNMKRSAILMFLSIFTATVDMVCIYGGVFFRTNWLEWLIRVSYLYIFFKVGYRMLLRIISWEDNPQIKEDSKSKFIKKFLIIFLCWIPYFVIFCPGVIHWDSMVEIKDFFDGYSSFIYAEGGYIEVTALLNDHHPVFDTLIYGLFVQIGNMLKNPNIGVALFSLTQMALFSASIAFFVGQMKRDGLSAKWEKRIVLFFALFPFWGIWSVTMVKDTLFTVSFVMYMSTYIKIVRNEAPKSARNIWLLLLWSVLLALTKKVGMYIAMFSNLGLLIGKRKMKLKILLSALAPCILIIVIMQNMLFPILKIYPGGKQETLGTMFMQTTRVIIDYRDEVSEEDVDIINGIMNYTGLEKAYWDYGGTYSQNVKALMRHDYTSEAFLKYFKLWFKWGLRHPWTYVKTVILMTGAFFNTYSNIEPYYTTRVMEDDCYGNIDEWVVTERLRDSVKNVLSWLYNMPILNILFKKVLYVLWIPMFCASEMYRKKKEMLIFLPVALSIMVLALSPCGMTRYALPVITVAPMLFAYCSANDCEMKER